MIAPVLETYATPDQVAERAAELFVEASRTAIKQHDRFVAVLSGGSTPKRLYRLLATERFSARVPWEKTLLTFGDERTVPPENSDSNFRMAKEALLDHVPIDASQVLRLEGEREPREAARRAEAALKIWFPDAAVPTADLTLLGMGGDGHTASLFPDTQALDEELDWVVANHVPQQDSMRLTWTYPAINGSRSVLALITGESKAPVVAEVFGRQEPTSPYPIVDIDPSGSYTVLFDDDARGRFVR